MVSPTSKRSALVVVLVMTLGVIIGAYLPGADVSAAPGREPGRIIVQFSDGTPTTAMSIAGADVDAVVERSVVASSREGVTFAVYASDTLSVEQLAAKFKGQPGVVAVSPDYIRSIDFWPNDPRLPELWALENTGQTGGLADADIDAATAWDASQGSGAVIACIDTGVVYTHADLAANMWRNPGEIPGDSIDNDGNGYVDDVYGIDSYEGDADPMDTHGHGTHAAGIMAGVGDNGLGIVGVAWRSKVMALRFLGPGGDGTDSAAIACINYAIDMKVQHGVNVVAINASWGGPDYDPVLLNAIDAAASAGIVFCAAAGNGGLNNDITPYYPASYSTANVIAVGSSTATDTRSSFSNYSATSVDLFAPGSGILSTYPGGYALQSGTSMAAPYVTGAVALVAALHPEDPVSTRVKRILLSVDKVPALSTYCATGGRLNAGAALAMAQPAITSLTPSSGPATGDTLVVIRGSGFVGLSGAGAVTFGGANATSYTVDSPTQITATAPAHASGTYSVRVTNLFGTSADSTSDDYTYIPVPVVSGLAPTFGPSIGGNRVIIFGASLYGATEVLFGSTPADFEVIADGRIDATAPPHEEGHVRVVVTTPEGASPDTIANEYLYADTPVIGSIAPAVGPIAGGNSVVITGDHFSGATAVSFGGEAATTFRIDSNTQITATAPTHSESTVPIVVTGPDGISGGTSPIGYRFVSRPTVSRVDPSTGPTQGDTEVLIEGSGFVGLEGASAVTFGGVPVTELTPISETQIAVTTPPGTAGAVRVQVVAAGGTSPEDAEATFTYTAPQMHTYDDTSARIAYAGSWANFTKTVASSGSYARANTAGSSATLTFRGDRLDWIAMKGTTTGKADVYLDGEYRDTVDLAAPTATYQVNVWSTGDLPSGLHEVVIRRSSSNITDKYITLDRVEVLGELVYPVPSITAVDPAKGSTAGGTRVTISGTAFEEVTAVTFGEDPATEYTVDSPEKITAIAPTHAEGTVQVHVVAGGGATPETEASHFTYTTAPPTTRSDATFSDPVFVQTGSWATFSTAAAYGGSYLRSSTPGASMVIPFNGTQLDWIAMKGTTTGKADVYLDGEYRDTVDLAAPTATYQVNVWSTGALAPGYHTVKIVRSASNLFGKYITVDAVDVAGILLAAERQEDAEWPFDWGPTSTAWATWSTTWASGGTYKYTNTPGADVTVEFAGVSLSIVARKASHYGKMEVTLDGTTSYTVDLYSSISLYKSTAWQSGFLTPGDHTVTITCLGSKNARSSGYTICLDAVDLIGEFR